jgi:hypothetical protein
VKNGHFADHLAGRGAGGPEGQADVVAGQVLGEQQIALGFPLVEDRHLLELAEETRDRALGTAGIAAHLHGHDPRHQHVEADDAVLDLLRRHLDGGEIATAAKDGRGAVANLADGRDRHRPADIFGKGGAKLRGRQTGQIVERDVGQREGDARVIGAASGQGARSTSPSTVSRAGGRAVGLSPDGRSPRESAPPGPEHSVPKAAPRCPRTQLPQEVPNEAGT